MSASDVIGMPRIVLAGRLIDPASLEVLEDRALTLRDGCVVDCREGRDLHRDELREGAVLDAGWATVLPGLIDSHCHLTFSAAGNHAEVRSLLAAESAAELTARAIANAQAHLSGGVTALRDTGGPGLLTLRIRDILNAGALAAPRVRACGPAITPPSGHLHYLGAVARGEVQVADWARRVLEAGADFVKVCASGGIMTAESDPMDPHYSTGELRAAVAEAVAAGTLVAAHALCAEGVRRCVAAGVRSIEHCMLQERPGEYAFDPAVAERMRFQGCVAGLTYAGLSQARYLEDVLGIPPKEDLGVWRSRMAARYESERALVRSGVEYVLHSDAGVRATPFGPFWLIPATAVLELGISPLEAIRAVTATPARLLGWDTLGNLRPGCAADFLVVEANPADDMRALREPRLVYSGGRLVAGGGLIQPRLV